MRCQSLLVWAFATFSMIQADLLARSPRELVRRNLEHHVKARDGPQPPHLAARMGQNQSPPPTPIPTPTPIKTPVSMPSPVKSIPSSKKVESTKKPSSVAKKSSTEKHSSIENHGSTKKGASSEKHGSTKKVAPHSTGKPNGHPYPVVTKTVIVVTDYFTQYCPGPTTLIECGETHIATCPTTITFKGPGPYTRTKCELSCYTTATEYYYPYDDSCHGWPYATGQGYTPISCPTEAPEAKSGHHHGHPKSSQGPPPPPQGQPPQGQPPAPQSTSPVKAPTVFNSGASRTQTGILLIAGLFAAVMVV
jgi:hypothetical protein